MPSEKRARQRAMREIKQASEQRRAKRRKTVRRSGVLVVLAAVAVAIVVVVTSSSGKPKPAAAHHPSTTTTAPATSTTTTSTTLPGTPTTAPLSHAAIAPTCPPATAAGAAKRVIAFTKAPPMCIKATGVYQALVQTDLGPFAIQMDAAASPAGVNNFVFLARYHFYDGIIFHRVVQDFVIQGGDPTGTGTGGPGYEFTGNLPPASCAAKSDCYPTWTVAYANSSGPSTDGSQFFIVLPSGGSQLSRNYTVLGKVISGFSVLEKIAADGAPATDTAGTPKVVHYMKKVTIAQVS